MTLLGGGKAVDAGCAALVVLGIFTACGGGGAGHGGSDTMGTSSGGGGGTSSSNGSGLTSSSSSNSTSSPTCLGHLCGTDGDCCDGLTCNPGNAGHTVCSTGSTCYLAGSGCGATFNCCAGAFCMTSNTGPTCVAPSMLAPRGAACSDNASCAANLMCVNNVCGSAVDCTASVTTNCCKAVGASCQMDRDCCGGLYCKIDYDSPPGTFTCAVGPAE